MKKQIVFILILVLAAWASPATAYISSGQVSSLRFSSQKDKPFKIAEFKKKKKRNKKKKRKKNIRRARNKRNDADGIIDDETQKVRAAGSSSMLDGAGPDIDLYHKKKRSIDSFRKKK